MQVNTAVNEMDKVVQQNAANSEESASASQEMSAQAQNMKHMVGELLALVGGRRTAETAPMKQSNPFNEARNAPSPKNGDQTHAPAAHKTKKTTAEQIIPLDDDFEDF